MDVNKFSPVEVFDYLHSDPGSWFEKARDLYLSANELEKHKDTNSSDRIDRDYRGVYYLLMGLCLECLYKGSIIKNMLESDVKPESGKIDSSIRGHDLVQLALTAGIDVDKRKKDILNCFSDYITWQGRYPTPTKAEKINGAIELYSYKSQRPFLTTIGTVITLKEIHGLILEAEDLF